MTKTKLILEGRDNIEIKWEDKGKGLTLSITGWTKDSSGQNHNDIYEKYVVGNPNFAKKAELTRIIGIWRKYHLNDLTPGTPKQMELLKGHNFGYKEAIEYLKDFDLAVDNGYAYGSAWLMTSIPEDVIKELNAIINNW